MGFMSSEFVEVAVDVGEASGHGMPSRERSVAVSSGFDEVLDSRMHRRELGPACLAEGPERIGVFRERERMHFFER